MKYLCAGLVAIIAVLGWLLSHTSDKLGERERELGEMAVANVIANIALAESKVEAARKDDAVANAAKKQRVSDAKATAAAHKLTEALHNEKATAYTGLSDDIVMSLCLRYYTARGDSHHKPGQPASSPDARKGNTPASQCDKWRGMTVGNVVVWTGYLLDHAGAERIDKEGIREWVEGRGNQ